eukprot:717042-Prorocentrum_minimum.AAC.1
MYDLLNLPSFGPPEESRGGREARGRAGEGAGGGASPEGAGGGGASEGALIMYSSGDMSTLPRIPVVVVMIRDK